MNDRQFRIDKSWAKPRRSSTGSAGPVLEWRETARTDLLSIVDYIPDDNPDAAQRLKDEIETKAEALPEHPKLYRIGREPCTREMVIGSNYVVVYAENPRAVIILRVLHTARQWPLERGD